MKEKRNKGEGMGAAKWIIIALFISVIIILLLPIPTLHLIGIIISNIINTIAGRITAAASYNATPGNPPPANVPKATRTTTNASAVAQARQQNHTYINVS